MGDFTKGDWIVEPCEEEDVRELGTFYDIWEISDVQREEGKTLTTKARVAKEIHIDDLPRLLAAPDMYEVLEALTECFDENDNCKIGDVYAVKKQAEAALSKARNEHKG